MKNLKVKRLTRNAALPGYATSGSAGFDLTATWVLESDGNLVYGTGLALEIPRNHVGLLFPRSSVHKKNLVLANCVGVIDSDYRGEVLFVFRQGLWKGERYEAGERVGQLLIVELPSIQVEEVGELSETVRGEGGFGSTGV